MFTCKKIRNGSAYLSTHLSANDYYCEQEQVTGVWLGKAAERLGISGQAIERNDAAFEALRLNQHPDGSGKLTPRNVRDSIRFLYLAEANGNRTHLSQQSCGTLVLKTRRVTRPYAPPVGNIAYFGCPFR